MRSAATREAHLLLSSPNKTAEKNSLLATSHEDRTATRNMCRWLTFISTEEMLLSDLVLKPSNSLVEQSIDASYHPGFAQRFNHQVNADGFGVGWYHNKTVFPAVFKDTDQVCTLGLACS